MEISKDEYRGRTAALTRAMADEGWDLLLVYARGSRNMYSNVLYLTGYYCFDPCEEAVFFLPLEGEPELVLNVDWDLRRAALTSWVSEIRSARHLAGAIIEYCSQPRFSSAKVGIVGHTYIPSSLYLEVKEGLSNHSLITATHLVERLRLTKSEREIELLRKAAHLTGLGIEAATNALREGVTEIQVVKEAYSAMLGNGAEEIAFTPQVSFGENTYVCMAPATRKPLQKGEMVMFDMGCLYHHYVGDLSRTRFLGQPTQEQRHIYEITLEAQEAAIEAVKPGMRAGEVDYVARSIIAEAGYGPYFDHWLGRGISLDLHEQPWMDVGDEAILEPGMIFSIEPGIYLPGVGGARIEDTILVTEKGYEVLSDVDKNLVI